MQTNFPFFDPIHQPNTWMNWLQSLATEPNDRQIVENEDFHTFSYLNSDEIKDRKEFEKIRVMNFKEIVQVTKTLLIEEKEPYLLSNQKKVIQFDINTKDHNYEKLFRIAKEILSITHIEHQLESLEKHLNQVKQNFSVALPGEREKENEVIFQSMKELYDLRKSIEEQNLISEKEIFVNKIIEFEQIANKINPHLPLLSDIVTIFGEEGIKPTLRETVEELCKGQINFHMMEKEKNLFQCDEVEIQAQYVRRKIKASTTDFPLSVVEGVERIMKQMLDIQQKEQHSETIDKYQVLFLPEKNKVDVVVIEGKVASGGFKDVYLATYFNNLKTTGNRYGLAFLQLQETKETPTTQEEYQQEINWCLKLQSSLGIWPTYKVVDIKGKIGMIQKAAQYAIGICTKDGVEGKWVSHLEDMRELAKSGVLTEEGQKDLLVMLQDVLSGVKSIHDLNLIHRDIRPPNLLCNSQGRAGVSDFGFICESTNDKRIKPVGAPPYVAPEVAYNAFHMEFPNSWDPIDQKLDIWSLGIILWEMIGQEEGEEHPSHLNLTQSTDYSSKTALGLLKEASLLAEKDSEARKLYEAYYTEPKDKTSLAHLVWWCTRPNPIDRPTIDQVIESYTLWFEQTLEKMKEKNTTQQFQIYQAFGEKPADFSTFKKPSSF